MLLKDKFLHSAKIFFFVCLFTFTLAHCNREGLEPGVFPPSFSLANEKGENVSLADFKGKVILINFWATWCPPCIAEMPALNSLYEKFKDKNFVVIGIASQDAKDDVDDFVKKSGITFPVLYDFDGKVSQKFKVNGFPETLLVSKEGKITLMNDPKSNELVLRVIGERVWDAPLVLEMIRKKIG